MKLEVNTRVNQYSKILHLTLRNLITARLILGRRQNEDKSSSDYLIHKLKMTEYLEQPNLKRKSAPSIKLKWTREEEAIMRQAVSDYGFDWFKISQQLPNRNPNQCAQKWKRLDVAKGTKHKYWTQKEDEKLLKLVSLVGKKWVQIAKKLKSRNSKQCRDRYVNKLDPDLKSNSFTPEEDNLIYEKFLLYGGKWTEITKFISGRSDSQVKNRFNTHIRVRFLELKNPYYTKQTKEDALKQLETARQEHLNKFGESGSNYENLVKSSNQLFINCLDFQLSIFESNNFIFQGQEDPSSYIE